MQVSSRTEAPKDGILAHGRRLIQERFAEQVSLNPRAVALISEEGPLTYGELDARANQLSQLLRRRGVGPETLVALYLERGPGMVVAILAVLKAGGAYVPIDLEYPRERITFILEDAQPVLVLTEQRLLSQLPRQPRQTLVLDAQMDALSGLSCQPLAKMGDPDQAAYVIYTSGSTGKPKGVVVSHGNVSRLFDSTHAWFQFSSSDVWTLFHSFAFDFSVWELWGALFYGGQLVIVPYAVSRSPEQFYEWLIREKVTVLNQTPSAFRQLIWADQVSPRRAELNLRWVIFGGEALDLQSLRPWFERHGDARPKLVNMYGITETTVHVTYRPIDGKDVEAGRGSVIGQPIPDLKLYVVDPSGQLCPPGKEGEIYVGGAGVARGYLNRPELTEERFVADPFSGRAGDRCYRSGDLARRLPDGDLEYLGRIDQQVKIRGFRIELGEIESTLARHPAVRECVVVAQGQVTGDRRLVAYLVCGPERPAVEALQAFLKERLPDYMVPALFLFLKQLPLTVHGKIDRGALPAPPTARPALAQTFEAPASPAEKVLAAIWREVLHLERVGVHDNFFALGGDSIRSIQVLARARLQGIPLGLAQLFEHPTIAELARAPHADDGESEPEARAPFSLLGPADRGKLPPGLEDAYPMTKLQVGMFYHSALDARSAIFHDVFSFRFALSLDAAKMKGAAGRLAKRHPVLRTSFDLGTYSEPLQLVRPWVEIPISVEDLRGQSAEQQRQALIKWVEVEKRHAFDWDRAPLLRLHVQCYSEDVFQMLVSFHHAIMDGWSLAAMLAELLQDYVASLRGTTSTLPAPPVTYADFVAAERAALQSEESRGFWRSHLKGAPVQQLPRWPASLRVSGHEQRRGPEVVFSNETLTGVRQLAQSLGVPLRTVLLAAHCRVMSFVTGQTDVVTGLVANGRPQVSGGERLIGLFLNTLPFRVKLGEGTWRGLVEAVFAQERALLPHRRLPLSEIQKETGGQPLFETVFDFVQFHVYQDVPGYGDRSFLEDHYFEANDFTFYATFMLDASGEHLQMHFDYDPNQLCEPQIRALCDYYSQTIEAIAQAPDTSYATHSPLSPQERARLLEEWNQTEWPIPNRSTLELIWDQVRRTPEALAVVCGDERLTYAGLQERALHLAGRLSEFGVRRGACVGILLPRSSEMLIAVLAVWAAGAAYVPLDPDYPVERLCFMIEDAGVQVVLGAKAYPDARLQALKGVVPVSRVLASSGAAASTPEPVPSGPEDVAYVIYTSGSTGVPKGVAITHRSLVNFLCSMQRTPGIGAEDTLLAITTLSFDIAALELFLPLTVGARLIIAPRETAQNPDLLTQCLDRHQVTILQATPATWTLLLEGGQWEPRSTLKALCGGEAMSRELAQRLLATCGEVWNMYGPTETTVWSCLARVSPGDGMVPIGGPIANTEAYVLDTELHLVPTGSEGELYLGGAGLAQGYLNRPELTAERFITHPFKAVPGARLYRTGDIARFLPDGTLLCLGRIDHQVKLRGFRVELGEIESVLSEHPAVGTAIAAAKNDGHDGKKLVAYYKRRGREVSGAELRRYLEAKLPTYMIPTSFVELSEFPTTPNGKIDRQRLPAPGEERPESVGRFVPPRTPFEEALAGLWQQILKVERVGISDSFLEMGGHSLLALQVIARVRHDFGVDLDLGSLLENPTLERFTLRVTEALLERESLTASALDEANETGHAAGWHGAIEPAAVPDRVEV